MAAAPVMEYPAAIRILYVRMEVVAGSDLVSIFDASMLAIQAARDR
jgi:hypothetical protein